VHRSPLLAILGTLAFTASTLAAPAKPREAWATGQIDHVDQAVRSIVVKQGSHEMTFVLVPNATLVEGKKTLQTSDLAAGVGHHVKVRYAMNGTSKIADRIEVSEAAKAHAKK
jgi:hypothetical protein